MEADLTFGDPIQVVWYDAAVAHGWKDLKDHDPKLVAVVTLGFFVSRDDAKLVVCPSLDDDTETPGGLAPLVIPRGCVHSITRLTLPK